MNYNRPVPAPYPHTFALSAAQSETYIFLLFVFALPFQRVIFLKDNLFGIQGCKPFNLLSAAVLAYLVFQGARLRPVDKIEQTSIRYFLLYLAMFTIAFIRSIPNAPLFHSRFPDVFPESYLDYVLSSYIVPSFYLLPFLFILSRMCSFQKVEKITTVICLSISLLSAAFVTLLLMNPSLLAAGGRDEMAELVSGRRDGMAELCETYFGVSYNTIGTMYICTIPLLVHNTLRRLYWIAPLGLSLLAILLLQSRSALVAVALSCCLLLVQRRRFDILAVGIAFVVAVSFVWIGSTLDALLSIGLGNSSNFSANALLTGRIDSVWAPLVDEWASDIGLFLFGAGRHGIIASELWYTGAILQATHAHNAIINFFLDCGAILSIVLIVFLCVGIATAWRVGRSLNIDLYWAFFACIFGLGLGMMTEREIFPTIDNMYVFPIIAMMINLARLRYLRAYRV